MCLSQSWFGLRTHFHTVKLDSEISFRVSYFAFFAAYEICLEFAYFYYYIHNNFWNILKSFELRIRVQETYIIIWLVTICINDYFK